MYTNSFSWCMLCMALKWHVPKCQLLAVSNINQKGFTYSFTTTSYIMNIMLYMIWNMIHRTAIYNGLHLTHLVAIIVLLPTYSSTAVNICPKSLQLKSVQNDLLNIQQSNVFSVDINNPRKTICVPASCKLLCVKQHGHLTTFAWCEFSYNKV